MGQRFARGFVACAIGPYYELRTREGRCPNYSKLASRCTGKQAICEWTFPKRILKKSRN